MALFFGVCFFLYFLKLSAGKGFSVYTTLLVAKQPISIKNFVHWDALQTRRKISDLFSFFLYTLYTTIKLHKTKITWCLTGPFTSVTLIYIKCVNVCSHDLYIKWIELFCIYDLEQSLFYSHVWIWHSPRQ